MKKKQQLIFTLRLKNIFCKQYTSEQSTACWTLLKRHLNFVSGNQLHSVQNITIIKSVWLRHSTVCNSGIVHNKIKIKTIVLGFRKAWKSKEIISGARSSENSGRHVESIPDVQCFPFEWHRLVQNGVGCIPFNVEIHGLGFEVSKTDPSLETWYNKLVKYLLKLLTFYRQYSYVAKIFWFFYFHRQVVYWNRSKPFRLCLRILWQSKCR